MTFTTSLPRGMPMGACWPARWRPPSPRRWSWRSSGVLMSLLGLYFLVVQREVAALSE
jgi:hypothetical protein